MNLLAFLCLVSYTLYTSAGEPGDIDATSNYLKPLQVKPTQSYDSDESVHVIRGLLEARQSCPSGYGFVPTRLAALR
jgi:hypothetical protein